MNADLITLGDLVADLVVPIESLPVEAQNHQPAEYIRVEPGGTGNTLVMAQRLGLQTKAIGSVGDDDFGRKVLGMLNAEGIDTSLALTLPDSTTTTALVLVDKQAQHVFIGQFGTGQPLPYDERWRKEIEQSRAIFVAGYSLRENGSLSHESLVQCLQLANQAGVPVFFDLGPAYTSAKREHVVEVFNYTRVLLATDEEICEWTGISNSLTAAHELLQQDIEIVIVKMGGAGCHIVTEGQSLHCKAYPVVVRDTAGAGDAFAAGVIHAYLNEYSLDKMGEMANAVGAATVAQLGTGSALPTQSEVEQLLQWY